MTNHAFLAGVCRLHINMQSCAAAANKPYCPEACQAARNPLLTLQTAKSGICAGMRAGG